MHKEWKKDPGVLTAIVAMIIVIFVAVAWNEDPADYVAPTTAKYVTGIVEGLSDEVPGLWYVTDYHCYMEDSTTPFCGGYMVHDYSLDFGQVVTLAIAAQPMYKQVVGRPVPVHIQVVDINKATH